MMGDLKSNPTFFSGINSKSGSNISEKLEDFVKLINTNNIPFKFEQNNNNIESNIPIGLCPIELGGYGRAIATNIEIQSSNDKELLELYTSSSDTILNKTIKSEEHKKELIGIILIKKDFNLQTVEDLQTSILKYKRDVGPIMDAKMMDSMIKMSNKNPSGPEFEKLCLMRNVITSMLEPLKIHDKLVNDIADIIKDKNLIPDDQIWNIRNLLM